MRFIPFIFIVLTTALLSNCDGGNTPERPESAVTITHVDISSLGVDTFEVTVGEFAKFIDATQYSTTADSFGWSGMWDTRLGEWSIAKGANWLRQDGKTNADSNMPVVHLSYRDACDYCKWRGGRLPTAAEWDLLAGDSVIVGNVWQGLFPRLDEGLDGYKSIAAPIGQFTSNVYGLYDMFGNVWEWTSTMDDRKGERIIKGGSFLCDYNVCQGYIPSRYQTTPDDSGLNHLGVRCVYDL